MENISLLRGLRLLLICTNIFGFIFAFVATVPFFRHNSPIALVFLLPLSAAISIYMYSLTHQDHLSAAVGAIRLPILANTNATSSPQQKPATRHGLIAIVDFFMACCLLTYHVVSMVLRYHNNSIVSILSLYAIFAMLGAAMLHGLLFVLHVAAWRKEMKDRKPMCGYCQRLMMGECGEHEGDAGQGAVRKDGIGNGNVGAGVL